MNATVADTPQLLPLPPFTVGKPPPAADDAVEDGVVGVVASPPQPLSPLLPGVCVVVAP